MAKKATKNKKLTPKQKAFVEELIANPKQTATEAARKAYSEPGKELAKGSAAVIAHNNLQKPQIISKLQNYTDLVESALVNTVSDWASEDAPRKREIALDAAKFIHDKVHGRATQKVEMQSQQVVITIDMTQPAPSEN